VLGSGPADGEPTWARVRIGGINDGERRDPGSRRVAHAERAERAGHPAPALEFGRALPGIRSVSEPHLRGQGLSRERVLAAAVRLTDLGFFRSGGDEYAADNGSFGLATIRREHVMCHQGEISFDYVGKSGKRHVQVIADDLASSAVRSLKHRRSWADCDDLLVFRSGGRWHNVTAGDINDYLRDISGGDFTAKDFRTWHATVLAAVGLAVSQAAESPTARKRAITRVVQEVADYLGNTPAPPRGNHLPPPRQRLAIASPAEPGRSEADSRDDYFPSVPGESGAVVVEIVARLDEAIRTRVAGRDRPDLEVRRVEEGLCAVALQIP
jgi:DNA topoisomerase IB